MLLSCKKEKTDILPPDEKSFWETWVPFVTNYDLSLLPVSDKYELLPETKGKVAMREASGIAWSRKNPGMIWAHNDSGSPNTLYLLDAANGEIIAMYKVQGTSNLDWEDIEVSAGPLNDESYIYVSDTGDNDQKKQEYLIYRFPEPIFLESHRGLLINVSDLKVDKLRFNYPDKSHDVEGLMVDPLTKDIFLATKRDLKSILFVAPYPQPLDELFTLLKAGTFSFRETSAASVSHDGQMVLIKNRQEIFYWERVFNEPFAKMLARTPVKAPYIVEPQGEAICFDPENNYFTLSEELNSSTRPLLYKYSLKN
jgi:hypothetical protein